MANHGFVTTRCKMTTDQIDADIREIAERRLYGLFEVEGPEKGADGIHASWFLSLKNQEKKSYIGFQVWLVGPRKLEFRHPVGDWLWWAQVCVMQDELGSKYNGMVSDEGADGKWKADPSKYPTYERWVTKHYESVFGRGVVGGMALKAWRAMMYQNQPQYVRATFKKMPKPK